MVKSVSHRSTSSRLAGVSLLLLVLATAPAVAATWTVNPDGSGDFATLQAAVDGAANGDILSLGDGTFSGAGNRDIVLVGRTLVLRSLSGDPDACVIDLAETAVSHRAFSLDGGTVRIYNVTIRNGHHTDGGAIHVAAGAPVFVNCRFRYNEATGSGAAVYAAAGADPEFSSCSFEDGIADLDGGAVLLGMTSAAEFTNCTFLNNAANRHGGAVASLASEATFDGCEFADNGAVDRGGAVYVTTGGAPTFDACVIRHNFADRGGAAACTGPTAPTFTDCVVYDNHAYVGGGGFHCDVLAEPEITGCTLVYNNSAGGAGLYCASEALPHVGNTLIAFNHGAAFDSDGVTTAVFACCDLFGNWDGDWVNGIETQLGMNNNLHLDPYLNDPAVTELYLTPNSSCLAVNNPGCGQIGARGAGGTQPTYHVVAGQQAMLPTIQAAIDLAPGGAVVMLHGTFTGDGNRDLVFNGKQIAVDGSSPEHTVIDCEGSEADPHRAFNFDLTDETPIAAIRGLTIRNGWAERGGGVALLNSAPTIEDVHFDNCRSANSGGAIYFDSEGYAAAPAIRDCVFEDNTATPASSGLGGAIFFRGGEGGLIADCEFRNGRAHNGGGIYVDLADGLLVSGCGFYDNQVTGFNSAWGGAIIINGGGTEVVDCQFDGNVADLGAGICVYRESTTITGCTFSGGVAVYDGGGVAVHQGYADITDCVFEFNAADGSGGGLSITHEGSIFGRMLSFEQNTASIAGGGLVQVGSAYRVDLDGCTFDSNEVTGAGSRGGGLYLEAEAYVADCRIETNTTSAAGYGGGVYAAAGATVGLELCELSGNVSSYGGGLFVDAANVDLDSCWLRNNHASFFGGGAYFDADPGSHAAWCTITGNTAGSFGGGLGFNNGSLTVLQNCSLVGNDADPLGAHLACWGESHPVVSQCILALAPTGSAVFVSGTGGEPYFDCSDIWGNAGGDWTGVIAYQLQDDGNFTADPRFCDQAAGDFTLFDTSPCLPENSLCGLLAGAWTQGCIDEGTPVPDAPPAAFALEPNVPNPFNPSTRVAFALPAPSVVDLAVYDAQGRCVRRLVRGEMYPVGRHEVCWDGTDDAGRHVGSGVYVLRLLAGGEQQTRKAVLLK